MGRVGHDQNAAEQAGQDGSSQIRVGRNGVGWYGMGLGLKAMGVDGIYRIRSKWVRSGQDRSGWDALDQNQMGRVGQDWDAAEQTGQVRMGQGSKPTPKAGGPSLGWGPCPTPSTSLPTGVHGRSAPSRARAAAEGRGCGAHRWGPPAPGRGHRRLLLLESHRAAGEHGNTPVQQAPFLCTVCI